MYEGGHGRPSEVLDSGDGLEGAEEAGAENDNYITLIVESSVQDMGWSSSAMPPDRVFIQEITGGSWAEEAGLLVDDELCKVAGKEVIDLDETSFADAIKERPLELVFYRVPVEDDGYINLVVESSIRDMGWTSITMAPERIFIEEMVEGSWAEKAGLQKGDELCKVAGVEVADLDESSYADAIKERPLELLFYRFSDTAEGGAEDDRWITLTLDTSVQEMGWTSSTMAPERMFIEEIVEGSWAEHAGLQKKDELFKVAGIEVIDLDEAAYTDAIKGRPLELIFYRFPDTEWQNHDNEAVVDMGDFVVSQYPKSAGEDANDASQTKSPRSQTSHASSKISKSSNKGRARSGSDPESESGKGQKTSSNGIRKSLQSRASSKPGEKQENSAVPKATGKMKKLASASSVGAASSRTSVATINRSRRLNRQQTSDAKSETKGEEASSSVTQARRLKRQQTSDAKSEAKGEASSEAPETAGKKQWNKLQAVMKLTRAANKERQEVIEGEDKSQETINQGGSVDALASSSSPRSPAQKWKLAGQALSFAMAAKHKGADNGLAKPNHIAASAAAMRFVSQEIAVAATGKKQRVAAYDEKMEKEFDVHAQGVWHSNQNESDLDGDLDVIAWRKRVRAGVAKSKAKAKRRPASADSIHRQKGLETSWMPTGRARSVLLSKREGFVGLASKEVRDSGKNAESADQNTPEQKWAAVLQKRNKDGKLEGKKLDKRLRSQVEHRVDFWFGEDLEAVKEDNVGSPRQRSATNELTEEDKVRKRALEKLHSHRKRREDIIKDATENLSQREIDALEAHLNFYMGFSNSKCTEEMRAISAEARKQREAKDKLKRKERAWNRYRVLHNIKGDFTIDMEKAQRLGLTNENLKDFLNKLMEEDREVNDDERQRQVALDGGEGIARRARETIVQIDDHDGSLRKRFMERVEEAYNQKEGTVLDELKANLKTYRGHWTITEFTGKRVSAGAVDEVCHIEIPTIAALTRSVAEKLKGNRQVPLPHQFITKDHKPKSLALLCMILYTKTDVDIDRLLGFKDVPMLPPGFELPAARDEFYRNYREMAKEQNRNPQMFQDANWGTRISWENCMDETSERAQEGWAKFVTWVKWICLLGVMIERFKPGKTVTRGLTGLPDSILENFKSKKHGDIIFWPALSSTTEDSLISWHYCNQQTPVEKNAIFTIKKVTEGLEIALVSQYPNEKELLLPPFSLLKVLRVSAEPDRPIEIECLFMGCDLSDSLKRKCEDEFALAAKQVFGAEEALTRHEKERIEMERKIKATRKVNIEENQDSDSSDSSFDERGYKKIKKKKRRRRRKGVGEEEHIDEASDISEELEVQEARIVPRFRMKKARELWEKWFRISLKAMVKIIENISAYVEKRLRKELGNQLPADFVFIPYESFPRIWERWNITSHLAPPEINKRVAFRPASNTAKVPLGTSYVNVSIHEYGGLPLHRVESAPGQIGGALRSDARTSTSTQRPSTASRRSTLMDNKRSTVLRFAPGV